MIAFLAALAFLGVFLGVGAFIVRASERRSGPGGTVIGLEARGKQLIARNRTMDEVWSFDVGQKLSGVMINIPYGYGADYNAYNNVAAPGEGIWHRFFHGFGRHKYLIAVASFENPASGGRVLGFPHPGTGVPAWQMDYSELLGPIAKSFGVDWSIRSMMRYSVGEQFMRVLILQHSSEWPWAVVVLDETGDGAPRLLGRFFNPGEIVEAAIHPTKTKMYLTLYGASASRDAGIVAFLDAQHPGGTAPEDKGSKYRCDECGDGAPADGLSKYWVFARSEVSRATKSNVNVVTSAQQSLSRRSRDGRNFVVYTNELNGDSSVVDRGGFAGTIGARYRFTADLEQLDDASFDERYQDARGQLETKRLVNKLEQSSERNGPAIVRAWEPGRGWFELRPARSGP